MKTRTAVAWTAGQRKISIDDLITRQLKPADINTRFGPMNSGESIRFAVMH